MRSFDEKMSNLWNLNFDWWRMSELFGKMLSYVLVAVTSLEVLLNTIVLISADRSGNIVRDLHWTKASYDGATVNQDSYAGIYFSYITTTGDDDSLPYSCDYTELCCSNALNSNDCNNCSIAGQVTIGFSTLAFICTFIALIMSCMRAFVSSYNTSVIKHVGTASVVTAVFSGFIALGVWAGLCNNSLATFYSNYSDITVTLGTAWGILLTSVILSIGSGILNVIIPASDVDISAPLTHARDSSSQMTTKAQNEKFCSSCGKKYTLEEQTKFCSSCGTLLQSSQV